MMEIRFKLTFLENLFLCLCLLTGLGQANGSAVVKVREGSEAVLPCFIRPKNIERDHFEWRKDRQKVFLYKNSLHSNNGLPGQDEQFKGRVSHFPDQLQSGNASIRIRDTKESDSGNYTCDFSPDESNRQIFTIDLVVVCSIIKDRWEENIRGASPQPCITLLEQTDDEAKLQCDVRRVFPKPKVKWQDSSGNILPAKEPQVIKRGGSYDIILKTTVTKTDDYRCVVTQEEICHQISAVASVFIYGVEPPEGFPTGLVVVGVVPAVLLLIVVVVLLAGLLYKYKKGEVSDLFVRTFETKDGMLLQCEVRGVSPKPKVEWQDSSGKILPVKEPQVTERGGKYIIILNTTVTKTGNYRCVVTQEGIGHQIDAEIYVFIPGGASELSVRTFKTDDEARLWCVVRGVSPKPKVKWQDSSGKILCTEELQVTERGDVYDIILETTVTKTGNYRCVAKQEGIKDQIYAEIFVFIPGAWGGFKRWFCWWCSFCNCCKKDSQMERKGDENSPESVELNRNHDTSAV